MKRFKHIKIISSLLLLVSLVTMSCSNLFDTLSDVKITYASVIGDVPSTKYVKANYVLTEADLPRLVQPGYAFKDWYIGDKPILPGQVVTNDMNLRGKWDINKYKIQFDPNGGRGELEPIDCKFGFKIKLPSMLGVLFKDNYSFVGWDTQKDGKGKRFVDAQEVMNLTTVNNDTVTLYAQWSNTDGKIAHIYYASQKGEVPEYVEKPIGSLFHESDLPNIEANGYRFLGWYNGTTKIVPNSVILGDMVLIGQWRKIGAVGSVIFDNSGDVDFNDTVKLKCQPDDAVIYYTKNGLTSTKKVYTAPIPITEDMTIEAYAEKEGMTKSDVSTAVFKLKKYTVSFRGNGYKDDIPVRGNFKKGDVLDFNSLPIIQRDGFEFAGWYLNGDKVDKDKTVTGDLVLVAQWKENGKVPNVIFNKNSEQPIAVDVGDLITLSCAENGAEIYYTLDKSDPITSPTRILYKDPIKIPKDDVVIKAMASKKDLESSDVTSNSYIVKTYSVSFNSNGGKNTPLTKHNLKKGDVLLPVDLPSDVIKDNNKFIGWTQNGKLITESSTLVIEGNTVLVAQWEQKGKTNNVTFSKLNAEVDCGDKITLSSPTKNAKIHYSSDKDPSEKIVDNNTDIVIDKECTITAYAKAEGLIDSDPVSSTYTLKYYTVSFKANKEGVLNPSISGTFKKGDTLSFSKLPNFAEQYSDFLGWYLDGSKVTTDITIDRNITLGAHWAEKGKTSDVIFSKNSLSDIPVDKGEEIILTSPTPEAKIYYTTDGNTEPTNSSTEYTAPIKIDSAVTIKAIAYKTGLAPSNVTHNSFTIKKYSVIFNSNGSLTKPETLTKVKGDEILASDLPTVEKDKAIFKGWTVNGELITDKLTVSGDVVLVAKFESTEQVKPVQFSCTGKVTRGTELTLTTETTGASIYYSLDGTLPNKNSTPYKDPIKIDEDMLITAIAIKENCPDSNIVQQSFTTNKTLYINASHVLNNGKYQDRIRKIQLVLGEQIKTISAVDFNGFNFFYKIDLTEEDMSKEIYLIFEDYNYHREVYLKMCSPSAPTTAIKIQDLFKNTKSSVALINGPETKIIDNQYWIVPPSHVTYEEPKMFGTSIVSTLDYTNGNWDWNNDIALALNGNSIVAKEGDKFDLTVFSVDGTELKDANVTVNGKPITYVAENNAYSYIITKDDADNNPKLKVVAEKDGAKMEFEYNIVYKKVTFIAKRPDSIQTDYGTKIIKKDEFWIDKFSNSRTESMTDYKAYGVAPVQGEKYCVIYLKDEEFPGIFDAVYYQYKIKTNDVTLYQVEDANADINKQSIKGSMATTTIDKNTREIIIDLSSVTLTVKEGGAYYPTGAHDFKFDKNGYRWSLP